MFVNVGEWRNKSMKEREELLFKQMEKQLQRKNAKMTRSQRAISQKPGVPVNVLAIF